MLKFIKTIFNKDKSGEAEAPSAPTQTNVKVVYNWYEDRLQKLSLQRNLLTLLVIGAVTVSVFMVLTIFSVSKLKTVEPFVIEISQKSGIATLVNPITVREYSANRAVAEYFIVKYLRARELFDPQHYQYYYYTEVRLLSSTEIYSAFRKTLSLNNLDSPLNRYSSIVSSDLKIRSIQYFDDNSVQIRFVVEYKSPGSTSEKARIVNLKYTYSNLNLNVSERYINPLGFVVTSYRESDEYL